ncbi:hypothetical protein R3P38DRAFT_2765675 [Favolaschia claudopus]|uniref:Uncharacterized protein n=1 Tax=Favolaschia claudopus TaxID=2862362 RepID=A0AAW0D766_9AGAR
MNGFPEMNTRDSRDPIQRSSGKESERQQMTLKKMRSPRGPSTDSCSHTTYGIESLSVEYWHSASRCRELFEVARASRPNLPLYPRQPAFTTQPTSRSLVSRAANSNKEHLLPWPAPPPSESAGRIHTISGLTDANKMSSRPVDYIISINLQIDSFSPSFLLPCRQSVVALAGIRWEWINAGHWVHVGNKGQGQGYFVLFPEQGHLKKRELMIVTLTLRCIPLPKRVEVIDKENAVHLKPICLDKLARLEAVAFMQKERWDFTWQKPESVGNKLHLHGALLKRVTDLLSCQQESALDPFICTLDPGLIMGTSNVVVYKLQLRLGWDEDLETPWLPHGRMHGGPFLRLRTTDSGVFARLGTTDHPKTVGSH